MPNLTEKYFKVIYNDYSKYVQKVKESVIKAIKYNDNIASN